MRMRHDFSDQGGDGQSFQTKAETARLSRPRRRRRDQETYLRYREGCGATLAIRAETAQIKADTARLFRPKRMRSEQETILRDREGCGATLAIRAETAQTKANTARLSRPRRRRRDFPGQSGYGATFKIKVRSQANFQVIAGRRDQESIPRDQGGNGVKFRPRPRRSDV